jgi:hypothetical protein
LQPKANCCSDFRNKSQSSKILTKNGAEDAKVRRKLRWELAQKRKQSSRWESGSKQKSYFIVWGEGRGAVCYVLCYTFCKHIL